MITTKNSGINEVTILSVQENVCLKRTDIVSTEEPLEIRLYYFDSGQVLQSKNISVTMRTPGHDKDLALGFLFTEGIISGLDELDTIEHSMTNCTQSKQNTIQVTLKADAQPLLYHAERNFYTSSSCGVCGKGSIAAIKTISQFANTSKPSLSIEPSLFYSLPNQLRKAQDNFEQSGGIHAAGLFSAQGDLLFLREDVGRHNALDKLIGVALNSDLLPLKKNILLLSGRASFELIQKAAMAGIAVVAAIGAPSSLAVELAKESDITLIGFLKQNRFNIYHLSKNITIPLEHEN